MKRLARMCCIALISLLSWSCSGSGSGTTASHTTPPDTSNVNTGNPGLPEVTAGLNSSQSVQAVAKVIYDAWEAKEDLTPYIRAVLEAFNVPTLGDAHISVAQTRLDQGLPLFTETEARNLADAFSRNSFVRIDTLESALGEQGVKVTISVPGYFSSSQPMGPGMLSYVMMPYSLSSEYLSWKEDEVLPALVLALGRERFKRIKLSGNIENPVWGDLYLDPLQFTLLQYSIMSKKGSSSGKSVPKVALPSGKRVPLDVAGWLKDQIQGEVTSKVGEQLEVPTDAKAGAQVSVCASLLLYGHKLKVKTDPAEIYYLGAGSPNLTKVTATLTFEDDYYKDDYYGGGASIDRWLREKLFNCTFPRKGPVPGKSIEWSVSEDLERHGHYDVTGSQTDADGESLATWRANDNKIPSGCSPTSFKKSAFGVATAKVKGLVPGWSTVEAIVGYARGSDTGTTGESRLEVFYFESEDISCPGGGDSEPHSY